MCACCACVVCVPDCVVLRGCVRARMACVRVRECGGYFQQTTQNVVSVLHPYEDILRCPAARRSPGYSPFVELALIHGAVDDGVAGAERGCWLLDACALQGSCHRSAWRGGLHSARRQDSCRRAALRVLRPVQCHRGCCPPRRRALAPLPLACAARSRGHLRW